MRRTVTHRLLDQALGRPLVDYLGELRSEGRSWREIARTVRERTEIEVSTESLRRWHEDAELAAATQTPEGTPDPVGARS